MDMYDQFVGMVATGRHMDAARVRAAGRRAGLYRAAGVAAWPGRCDRRRAGRAAWLARQGRAGRSAGRGCVDQRPRRAERFPASLGWCSTALWKSLISQGLCLTARGRLATFRRLNWPWRRSGMTKSELIAELASRQSAPARGGRRADRRHHLRGDHHRAGTRRTGGAARLWRLHGEAPRRAHRAQPAHRRGGAGGREGGAVLQGRQGAARAGQSARPRSIAGHAPRAAESA